MSGHVYHERLELTNFTIFEKANWEFVPGINVFVGENGTGKTHVMKLLYSQHLSWQRRRGLQDVLSGVFQTDDLGQLVTEPPLIAISEVLGWCGGKDWGFGIVPGSKAELLIMDCCEPPTSRPVFIPAMDMMGHTRRFVSTYDEHQIDFDQTQRDIVALLLSPERRNGRAPNPVLETLETALGGTVEEEGERFYLVTPDGRQPMPLVAEGLRKVATLHQLVRNGWLEPGSVLFWDEPEVNLNPRLMDEVVGALLALGRSGVQIFLTTHSYVILKELDLQATAEDRLRFFAFSLVEGRSQVTPADDYAGLTPNPIAEQFDRLYDLELTRATGRPRA